MVTSPFTSSSDLFALSLQKSFSTDRPPWQSLNPGTPVADAKIAPSADLRHLILVGLQEPQQLLAIYDMDAGDWSRLTTFSGITPTAPRQSLGIALDPQNKFNLFFGGLVSGNPTREFDVLDTGVDRSQWKWMSNSGAWNMPLLVQPVMVYVPMLQSTLVMGGCTKQTAANGCALFDAVYLVRTTETGEPTIVSKTVTGAAGGIPSPRQSACVAVLNNGNVFMYGGMDVSKGMNDFWILDTTQWSWSRVVIDRAPEQPRAGATCENVGQNQVMVIGGFVGGTTGERAFSDPQIAIVNLATRSWTNKFSSSSTGLSTAAVVAISAGCSFVVCVFFLFIARKAWQWRRKKRIFRARTKPQEQQHHPSTAGDSLSRLPLMEDSTIESNTASTSPSTSPSVFRDALSSSSQTSLPFSKSRNFLPLIIMPYSPSSSGISSNSTVNVSSSTKLSTLLPKTDLRSVPETGTAAAAADLPESTRMTQAMADQQLSQYVKTQQHSRHYERRRQMEEGYSGLNRSGTHYTYKHDPEQDGVDLATGMIALKEVEMGEESIMTPLSGLETGAILVSTHLPSRPVSYDAVPHDENHDSQGSDTAVSITMPVTHSMAKPKPTPIPIAMPMPMPMPMPQPMFPQKQAPSTHPGHLLSPLSSPVAYTPKTTYQGQKQIPITRTPFMTIHEEK
ncbi:hypothetical protein BGZ94_002073 [Podila epigama]|nr:hypothetical protein BGZ94_002073 [Podila epigama]